MLSKNIFLLIEDHLFCVFCIVWDIIVIPLVEDSLKIQLKQIYLGSRVKPVYFFSCSLLNVKISNFANNFDLPPLVHCTVVPRAVVMQISRLSTQNMLIFQ